MFYLLTIFILVIVIVFLILILILQKNKFKEKELLNKNKLSDINNNYSIALQEKLILRKKLDNYQMKESQTNNVDSITNNKTKIEPIYKGKRALVGDYFTPSSNITKEVLERLGFEVDVIEKSQDVIQIIKSNNNYDVIFSNNIYKDGTGPECLKELRKIEGFNTPVIINTVSKNQEDYFINVIGFDGYIVKPITIDNVKPVLQKILNKWKLKGICDLILMLYMSFSFCNRLFLKNLENLF